MSSRRSPKLRYPGGRAALLGAGAFLAAFVVTYLVVGVDFWPALDSIVVDPSSSGDSASLKEGLQGLTLSEGGVGTSLYEVTVEGWKVTGVFLFGAHFVRSVVLPDVFDASIAPVLDAGGPYLLLMLVPPAALAIAGFLATRHVSGPYDFRYDLGGSTARRYAWNAALPVLFGYVPFVLVGLVLFVGVFTPNLLTGFILAGLVYPFAFGGLGGFVAYLANDDYESDTDNAVLRRVQRSD